MYGLRQTQRHAKRHRRIPAWIGIGQLLHQCILLLDALWLHERHELEENIHHTEVGAIRLLLNDSVLQFRRDTNQKSGKKQSSTVWNLIGMSSLIFI